MGSAPRIPENLCVYDLNMFMIRTHMLRDSQFIYCSQKSVLSVCSANTSGKFVCKRESFPHGGWTAKIKDVPLQPHLNFSWWIIWATLVMAQRPEVIQTQNDGSWPRAYKLWMIKRPTGTGWQWDVRLNDSEKGLKSEHKELIFAAIEKLSHKRKQGW